SYSNIIDVNASRLRRKLDEDHEVPMFTTLRGVGYMLVIPDATAAPSEPSVSHALDVPNALHAPLDVDSSTGATPPAPPARLRT
ncbi:MAG: winged helix-turn-helix domain-containing protein, partial [Gemmatimonadaceae bacterium]|nr:winged helix-turn-helix domain-containing protein [Gemmatimonadaceae bacterium]